jgi:mRNA interferase RelE/StbE
VPYILRYHPRVAEDDLQEIPANLRARIAGAIDERLTTEPARYGLPLRATLKGYWKLRVGDYRIVFKIAGREVWILTIQHRREVYDAAVARFAWTPEVGRGGSRARRVGSLAARGALEDLIGPRQHGRRDRSRGSPSS